MQWTSNMICHERLFWRSEAKPSTKAFPGFFSREWKIQLLGNWLPSAPTSTAFSMTCKINWFCQNDHTYIRTILPLNCPGLLPHRKWNSHSSGKRLQSASTSTAYWITYKYCSYSSCKECTLNKTKWRLLVNHPAKEKITYLFNALVQFKTAFFGKAGSNLQWMDSCLWKKKNSNLVNELHHLVTITVADVTWIIISVTKSALIFLPSWSLLVNLGPTPKFSSYPQNWTLLSNWPDQFPSNKSSSQLQNRITFWSKFPSSLASIN